MNGKFQTVVTATINTGQIKSSGASGSIKYDHQIEHVDQIAERRDQFEPEPIVVKVSGTGWTVRYRAGAVTRVMSSIRYIKGKLLQFMDAQL